MSEGLPAQLLKELTAADIQSAALYLEKSSHRKLRRLAKSFLEDNFPGYILGKRHVGYYEGGWGFVTGFEICEKSSGASTRVGLGIYFDAKGSLQPIPYILEGTSDELAEAFEEWERCDISSFKKSDWLNLTAASPSPPLSTPADSPQAASMKVDSVFAGFFQRCPDFSDVEDFEYTIKADHHSRITCTLPQSEDLRLCIRVTDGEVILNLVKKIGQAVPSEVGRDWQNMPHNLTASDVAQAVNFLRPQLV